MVLSESSRMIAAIPTLRVHLRKEYGANNWRDVVKNTLFYNILRKNNPSERIPESFTKKDDENASPWGGRGGLKS
jgi:hypothetical protein